MAIYSQPTPNSPRRKRRIGRVIAAICAALLLLGAAYEAASETLDTRRYPPPGKLVAMGGYSLHLYCTGQGSPTVVLEAGLGGGVVTWPFVQPEVAKSTRVCSYDRAGWAWSGGMTPASGQETATRLHTLLEKAGEKGPYVLVGHSLGGLYNQLFAATYPADVAGMVMVEARHPEFSQRVPAANSRGSVLNRVLVPVLTRLGVVRILGHMGALPGAAANLPQGMVAMAIRPSSQNSAAAEQNLISEVEAEVRSRSFPMGDKPLLVISRDHDLDASPDAATWLETQRLFLTVSTRSRLVEAKGSSHMVPYDRPDAVVAAIAEVLDQTRR